MIKPKRPVVLLPGFVVGKYSMIFWKRRLSQTYYADKGYLKARKELPAPESWSINSVVVVPYYAYDIRTLGLIDQYSERLRESVDFVRACTDSEKVDIIAHSMGGLVARLYIQKKWRSGQSRKLSYVGSS